MANNKKAPTSQAKYIDSNQVGLYILNNQALIGNLVTKDNEQYLIISNSQGDVTDIRKATPGMTISGTGNTPILVFGNEQEAGAHIHPKFYRGSTEYTVVQNPNSSQDIMYDANFGNNAGFAISNYERVQVYQRALSLLDDRSIIDDAAVNEYLSKAARAYADTSRELDDRLYTGDRFGDVRRQERTTHTILSDNTHDNESAAAFSARVKMAALDMYASTSETKISELDARAHSFYSSEFERTKAIHDLEVAQMSSSFYATSQTLLTRFKDDLARDNLIDYVGVNSEVAFNRINAAIGHNQTQIQQYIYNEEPSSEISKRAEYLAALTALSEHNPYIVTSDHANPTNYINAANSHGNTSEPAYHFMADQNIYASMHNTLGGHGRAADQASQHTLPLYGDMSQREFYERMCARSAVISVISSRKGSIAAIYTSNTVPETIDPEYARTHHLTVGEEWSISERRDYISSRTLVQYLPDDVNKQFAQEYMMSAEFTSIISNTNSMYIGDNKGNQYRINPEDGSTMAVGTAKGETGLRPEFAIAWHEYDLSKPSDCQKLEDAIRTQIKIDKYLHERPNVELAEGLRFIREYEMFNQHSQSAEYNLVMSRGLREPRVEYGATTLEMLNSTHMLQCNAMIQDLRGRGYDIDFTNNPSSEQMYKNYYAIQYGVSELREAKVKDIHDALIELKHVTNDPNNPGSFEKVARVLAELDNETNAKKRAEELADAAGVIININKMTEAELRAFASVLSDQEIEAVERIHGYSTKPSEAVPSVADTLAASLLDDIKKNEISITEGLNALNDQYYPVNLYGNDPMLSFGYAMTHSNNVEQAINEVIQNHQVRNMIIDTINEAAQNSETRVEFARSFSDVIAIVDRNGTNDEIALAAQKCHIDLSPDDPAMETFKKLVVRDEVRAEIERLEHVKAAEEYTVRMQKTEGFEEVGNIYLRCAKMNVNMDMTRLDDQEYIHRLSKIADPMTFRVAVAESNGNEELAISRVVEQHRIRNELIDNINQELSYPAQRAEFVQNLSKMDSVLQGHATTEDIVSLAKLCKIEVNETNFDAVKDVLTRQEVRFELNRVVSMMDDHTDAIHTGYSMTMHKTNGIEEISNIYTQCKNNNLAIDVSRLDDRDYLAYLSETATSAGKQDLSNAIRGVVDANQNLDIIVVARNVEELTHRADLTAAEKNNIITIAKNAAFETALTEGTDNFALRREQYSMMIDDAANPNNVSVYMQTKLDDIQASMTSDIRSIETCISHGAPAHEIQNSLTLANNGKQYNGFNDIQQLVINPEMLFEQRTAIENELKNNPYYSEYIATNNNAQKHINLENVRDQIAECETKLMHTKALYEQYSEAAHGVIGKIKYGGMAKGFEAEIGYVESELADLRAKEQKSLLAIKNTYGEVDEYIEQSQNAFVRHNNAEFARTFVTDVVVEYGHNTELTTTVTRNANIEKYSNAELCEAMRYIDPPLAVKEEYYRAGALLSSTQQQECWDKIEMIKQDILMELSKEVNPAAKTAVTPELIQVAIDQKQAAIELTTDASAKMELQSSLDRLKQIQSDFDTISNVPCKTISESVVVLARYRSEAISIEQDYTSAELTRQEFEKKVADLERMQELLTTYGRVEALRDSVSTLSEHERIAFARSITTDNTVEYQTLATTMRENGNSEIVRFSNAFEALHSSQTQIESLFEKLDKPNYKFNEGDVKLLRIINEYNESLGALSSDDKATIRTSIIEHHSGVVSESNIKAIDAYMLTPIEAHNVAAVIEQHHEQIVIPEHKTIVQQYSELSEHDKMIIFEKCFMPSDQGYTREELTFATMAVSEHGIQHYANAIQEARQQADAENGHIPGNPTFDVADMQGMGDQKGQIYFVGDMEEIISKKFIELGNGNEEEREAQKFCFDKIDARDELDNAGNHSLADSQEYKAKLAVEDAENAHTDDHEVAN